MYVIDLVHSETASDAMLAPARLSYKYFSSICICVFSHFSRLTSHLCQKTSDCRNALALRSFCYPNGRNACAKCTDIQPETIGHII